MGHCDGCGKDRRSVRSVGHDANGDPDAPDLCFLCRSEGERGRSWCPKRQAYAPSAVLVAEAMAEDAKNEPDHEQAAWLAAMGDVEDAPF